VCIEMFTFIVSKSDCIREPRTAGTIELSSNIKLRSKPPSVGCMLRLTDGVPRFVVHPAITSRQQGFVLFDSVSGAGTTVTELAASGRHRLKLQETLFPHAHSRERNSQDHIIKALG
jgi:hypothetical protein